MRSRLVVLLTLVSCGFVQFIARNPQSNSFTVTKVYTIVEDAEGRRSPPRTLPCAIDFETESVVSSFAKDVLEYTFVQ